MGIFGKLGRSIAGVFRGGQDDEGEMIPGSLEEETSDSAPASTAGSVAAYETDQDADVDVSALLSGGESGEEEEGELQDAAPSEAVGAEPTSGVDAFLLDVFKNDDLVEDEARDIPAGLVEIDTRDLLNDCEALLQRLKQGSRRL